MPQIQLFDGKKISFTKSINGLDLEIKKTNGILYVNGAEVVESNIKFSKGVIHLTNRVLIPK